MEFTQFIIIIIYFFFFGRKGSSQYGLIYLIYLTDNAIQLDLGNLIFHISISNAHTTLPQQLSHFLTKHLSITS